MENPEFSDSNPVMLDQRPSVSGDHSPSSEYRNLGFDSEPLSGKKLPCASSDASGRSSCGSIDIDDLEGVRNVLRKRRLSRQSAVMNQIMPPETHSGIKVLFLTEFLVAFICARILFCAFIC